MKEKDLNRFKGCLYGGAIGDALGYAVEFLNIEQIREQYGPQGITKPQLVNGKALLSDDTQMTLFTANGILVGMTEQRLKGERREIERYIHNAYMDWHKTQRIMSIRGGGDVTCWIYHAKEMHSVRAPGGTCLRSLASGVLGTMEHPINSSKGCGGLMRVAPIGLYFDRAHYTLEETDRIGARTAALTHGHPLGYLPAAALVHIINQIVYGDFSGDDALYDIIRDCIDSMGREFSGVEKVGVLQAKLREAVELARDEGNDLTAVSQLGEGWVAEEALAISVYCALRYRNDFVKAMMASVNHSGDSDSTAAVTGNILGTYIGFDSIPTSYAVDLELSDLIREITEDLYADCANDDRAHCLTEKWQKKYVKADYRL